MKAFLNQKINDKIAISLIVAIALISGGLVWWNLALICRPLISLREFTAPKGQFINMPVALEVGKTVKSFTNVEEFKDYLQQAQIIGRNSGYGVRSMSAKTMAVDDLAVPTTAGSLSNEAAVPSRISSTNVQVYGLDEPDVLKNDAKNIYYSSEQSYRGGIVPLMAAIKTEIARPNYQNEINIFKAWPVSELSKLAKIEKTGELLLADNLLMVIGNQEIQAYDVTDPQKPQEKWQLRLADDSFLAAARLYQDKLYLIAKDNINESKPCPFYPVRSQEKLAISCSQIYHPITPAPIDTTFVTMAVNLKNGQVEGTSSFVGSAGNSVIYVSPQAIYLSYTYSTSQTKFYYDFFTTDGQGLIDRSIVEKLGKLENYDLGSSAKLTEWNETWNRYLSGLNQDDRLKLENDLSNKLSAYYQNHLRDLEKTGIAKINLADLQVAAVGQVPGRPLNQFSLDEYNNNLRIAVTVGEGGFWGLTNNIGREQSVSDVYILNKQLGVLSSVQNLGKGERIYSARFIGNRGYVVTFRQTDPFYVLDLTNPQKAKLSGELKIPGYSSYLHPLADNKILGVGQENNSVKLSYFDVSNPNNPKEISKYSLNEYWTEISSNHHAFLQDSKHQVFFIPGTQGGYIFSYAGDTLKLVKAISGQQIKRALYLSDYLYLIGQNKITVLDENKWENVKELDY